MWSQIEDFPLVPDDMEVRVFAQEPLVRNPCAITFDSKGRLFVGMGPQYRRPKPETEGDKVFVLYDSDQDGVADGRKAFAEGLNNIQGMVWLGDQLWIANSPDLTVVEIWMGMTRLTSICACTPISVILNMDFTV